MKCCLTLASIEISFKVIPRSPASLTALFFVLFVVPKPGIVTAIIPLVSRFIFLKALYITSSARVESSPPETPTTALFDFVCNNLRDKPAT